MRNPIFDIMKFIAIIAMIVGHCVHDWRQTAIYCWHMPLFFFVSGYFFKPTKLRTSIKINAQRLLIPYLIGAVGIIICLFILYHDRPNLNIGLQIKSLVFGGGYLYWNNHPFQIWFLFALFLCNIIYLILYKYSKNIVYLTISSITVSCMGAYIGAQYGKYIPFQLTQACCAIIFFHIGYYFRRYNSIVPKSHSWIWWCLSILFLLLSFYAGSLDMFKNFYSLFPINVLGAIGGIFIVMQFCYLCNNMTPKLALILAQLGSISILIYLVHFIEFSSGLSTLITKKLLFFIENYEQTTIEKILFALIVSLLLYQIPIVRRILRLSNHYQHIDNNQLKS